MLYVAPQFLAATSTAFVPGASTSGTNYTLTGNSVALPAGSWMIHGAVTFFNTGTTPIYTLGIGFWSTANGAQTAPTLDAGLVQAQLPVSAASNLTATMPTIRMTLTAATTLFLVPQIFATTTTNASITTYIYAERIK